MMFRARLLALFLLAIAATALWPADPALAESRATRFEIEFFQHGSSEPMNHATILISDRRVRIEQRRTGALEGGPVLVYRGDKDLVLSISDREQQYSRIERSMLRLLGMKSTRVESRATRRAVDGHLSGLPSDQQRALERVLGLSRSDSPGVPLVVEHEVEANSFAGIECKKVTMSRGKRSVGDACVASWTSVGLDQSDIEVFRTLANFQRDVLGARGVTPLEFVPDQAFDLIVQFDGFPLSFRRIVDEEERSAIRIRSIEHLAADDSLFSAPSGYALRAGFSAFFAHLSARESVETDPASPAASPDRRAVQPAASLAPAPRKPADRRARRPIPRRSISVVP